MSTAVGSSPDALRHGVTRRTAAVRSAAALLVLAAVLHAVVAPPHLDEYLPAGVFFVALAVAQLADAALLLARPRGLVLTATVWMQAVAVGLYSVSRTVDLALGPPEHDGGGLDHAVGGRGDGTPRLPGAGIESVGTLDVVCVLAELAIVAIVVQLLGATERRRTATALAVLALSGLVVWTARALR